ncbi:patatin-like phospholipase family protein [Pedobacter sp. P351]|uniref:patatin-like phospholipase family protein n=1 Tax=Pedobacter superstes TaxID=3133441 RepID=UPI0030A7AD33
MGIIRHLFKSANKWFSGPQVQNHAVKRKKILSIDGGGIRGIIAGQILIALEKKLQERSGNPDARIADYFDFFTGTSTGGILVCLYLCPSADDPKKPRYSAEEAIGLYIKNGYEIFKLSIWKKISNPEGIIHEIYNVVELERILKKYFGSIKLSELLKPCIITSYNINKRNPHFFTQHDAAKSGDSDNFLVCDVCRATSAAPTYFETALVKSLSGVSYPLVDGGVFANNPALCAYSEVHNSKGFPIAKDMFIVSIGTGVARKPFQINNAIGWGTIAWSRPMIDLMMSTASETIDFYLKKIFAAHGNERNYIRIQPTSFRNAKPKIDNATQENIAALIEVGNITAMDFSDDLDRIVNILLEGPDPVEF